MDPVLLTCGEIGYKTAMIYWSMGMLHTWPQVKIIIIINQSSSSTQSDVCSILYDVRHMVHDTFIFYYTYNGESNNSSVIVINWYILKACEKLKPRLFAVSL